ncbi:DUF6447 family protein [Halomonas almeriensis]|uniref:DUF6447 family protein n=1 Tax=Halomonas almeriensis TaxID=308163 RepID=UPI0025B5A74F|nr:DUF6447 family protein [Halomonas almeriensis]MDN3553489.1 DUF6447 family protein [Halomonas almeriensis]
MTAQSQEQSQTVTIDGKEYQLDQLTESARNQVVNLQVTDQEIQRLQHQLAIAQTARTAYSNELKSELDKLG